MRVWELIKELQKMPASQRVVVNKYILAKVYRVRLIDYKNDPDVLKSFKRKVVVIDIHPELTGPTE